MHKFFMMGVMALLALSCAQTPEKRAQELISKLTLEEKTSLMMHPSAPVEALGIPAYDWWNEALHGVARNGKATVFPMPIAMAASFDEPLVNEVFTAVSDEARVKNRWAVQSGHVGQYQGLTFWTPNINIFRDPRWGRGMETYGEDPYLTGQLGMAVVRGLQGPSDAKVLKAHACAKHFAVHSGPEWNRHSYNAVVSERDCVRLRRHLQFLRARLPRLQRGRPPRRRHSHPYWYGPQLRRQLPLHSRGRSEGPFG